MKTWHYLVLEGLILLAVVLIIVLSVAGVVR
jgi:hypothetical protein